MKKKHIVYTIFGALLLLVFAFTFAPEKAPSTDLRQILLAQLKKTHVEKDWFVPANVAVAGLSAEQAQWHDTAGNHSIGQLTYHMVFWNERQVLSFKGQKPADFTGNNEETFTSFDKKTWDATVVKLDKVMLELEKLVENATEAQLKEWAPTIANISTHNAYHTGQIVYIRKLQGSWNPEQGVK